jgi:hypothetical protein
MLTPKGRNPMIGANNFIDPVAKQESAIVRRNPNLFQWGKLPIEITNIRHAVSSFRKGLGV